MDFPCIACADQESEKESPRRAERRRTPAIMPDWLEFDLPRAGVEEEEGEKKTRAAADRSTMPWSKREPPLRAIGHRFADRCLHYTASPLLFNGVLGLLLF